MSARRAASPVVARLGVIALLVLAWEIAARLWGTPETVAPPSRVIASLGDFFAVEGVVSALLITLWEVALAFVIAVAIGILVGLSIGLSRFAHKTAMPIVFLLYATPQVTILPLFILLFGIGPASKVAFGVTHGMFPIMVTVIASVQNLNPALTRAAVSMGASPWQRFRHVVFPHMIPAFFTGMRLGMTGVLLGVLLAELYSSQAGIGSFARAFTLSQDPTNLFALVAVVATIAIALNELARRAEKRFSRWRA